MYSYIWWIDIDDNPLVENQNDQVTKDAKQKQNLKERNKLLGHESIAYIKKHWKTALPSFATVQFEKVTWPGKIQLLLTTALGWADIPIYGLDRYVQLSRVTFLRFSILKVAKHSFRTCFCWCNSVHTQG